MAEFVECQDSEESGSVGCGKRKRGANWTELEKYILVDEYNRRRSIFSADFSTIISNKTKQDAWSSLVESLHSRTGTKRTLAEVKKKWENLLNKAKKEQLKEVGGPDRGSTVDFVCEMADSVGSCAESPVESETSGKRKRGANWTDLEKYILVDEYNKRKYILSAAFSPTVTSKTKQDAWASLVASFHTRSGTQRTLTEVKKKWENLLMTSKKEHVKEMTERGNADVCSYPDHPSEISKKVRDAYPEDSPSFSAVGSEIETFILSDPRVACDDSHNGENSGYSDVYEDDSTQNSILSDAMSPVVTLTEKPTRNHLKDTTTTLYAEVLQLEKEKLKLEIDFIKMKTKNAELKNLKLMADLGFPVKET